MSEVLDQLLEAQWRGLGFPVTRMRATIAHDLVEHKYWGVDGARVESTGLAPWRYTFSVPFINGLRPGRSEKWSDLYPNQFRRLAAAFQDRSRGVLQHPEFGEIACKAERFEIDWSSDRRGGVDAELSFVETKVDGDKGFLDFPSPVQEVDIGAIDLDSPQNKVAIKDILKAAGVDLPPYLADKDPFSFTDAMSAVKSVSDTPGLLERRVGGRIDSVVYQAERVADSVKAAKNALTWPVTQSTERIKANAHELDKKLISGRRRVGLFTVPADTTMSGVARQIRGATVGDLMRLNPQLMVRPEILRGTVVRYYLPEERPAAA
jgi:hypothetical protein